MRVLFADDDAIARTLLAAVVADLGHEVVVAEDGEHAWQLFQDAPTPLVVRCDFDALPFATRSLDLIVLPHALEFARDPHRALAEVDPILAGRRSSVVAK